MSLRLRALVVLCVSLLASLAFSAPSPAAASPRLHAPKLIVFIAVDQMRADYLERFAPYEKGGLHYFHQEGAVFANANYHHIPTETGPGHSVLLSGRNPAHTGIVANEWYDRGSRAMVYCVADPAAPLLASADGPNAGPGVSPRNFLGVGLGDQLQRAYPQARVYSISLKDRAAVLMGGRRPTAAFWFSTSSGDFTSSHYYFPALPNWVEDFDRTHAAASFAGKPWDLLLGAASPAYPHADHPFLHVMPDAVGPRLYSSVFASPFGDEILERFAEHLIRKQKLGTGAEPDLLAISFSSNDAIGHGYGPDSPELADEQLRLDRTIGHLVEFVNQRLGVNNVLWALSADHGVQPLPEAERALRHNIAAERIPPAAMIAAVDDQLGRIFHQPANFHWLAGTADSMLYLDRANLAAHGISFNAVGRALATRVHAPGIAHFYPASEVAHVPNPAGGFLRNSYVPGRSGDVYAVAREWTLLSAYPTGTSHGTIYPYDTHVPLVLAGDGILPMRITTPVHVTDLAPTLAALVGIPWRTDEAESQSRATLIRH
ncbi:MAG: alkaline phosphatase family protein [Terriglobales bacterium]